MTVPELVEKAGTYVEQFQLIHVGFISARYWRQSFSQSIPFSSKTITFANDCSKRIEIAVGVILIFRCLMASRHYGSQHQYR